MEVYLYISKWGTGKYYAELREEKTHKCIKYFWKGVNSDYANMIRVKKYNNKHEIRVVRVCGDTGYFENDFYNI